MPPPEAVALLDRTWDRLINEVGVPVIAIPGNHDSATRVGFGARLLARSGLHIVADFETATRPIPVGDVDVYALPFTDPAMVRDWAKDPEIRDHTSALRACVDRMRPNFTSDRPRILVAHAFVSGQRRESESERPLSVGGAGTVDADAFRDFDYVALGHLHAPQVVSARCVYSGSPLKYSFSEADDLKSMLIVELQSGAAPSLRSIPLRPRRNVRNLKGQLAELVAAAPNDPAREDYLRVTLTDPGALLNAIGRLREAFPNVLQLERSFLDNSTATTSAASRREASEVDLFTSFFREVIGSSPDKAELAIFQEALEDLRRTEAENPEVTV